MWGVTVMNRAALRDWAARSAKALVAAVVPVVVAVITQAIIELGDMTTASVTAGATGVAVYATRNRKA